MVELPHLDDAVRVEHDVALVHRAAAHAQRLGRVRLRLRVRVRVRARVRVRVRGRVGVRVGVRVRVIGYTYPLHSIEDVVEL